jgi:hypothetical protein
VRDVEPDDHVMETWLHPGLQTTVDDYLDRGYTLKESTATTAVLNEPGRWWHLPLLIASIFNGAADDPSGRVRLYVDSDGRVWRRPGWLFFVFGRRRKP